MNVCTFTGFMVDDPVLKKTDDDVSFLRFTFVTYAYRRTKSGDKNRIPTYLTFEAWDTGAETIAKLAKRNTKMTIQASARNFSKEDDGIIFRVNEFDFSCLEDKDSK